MWHEIQFLVDQADPERQRIARGLNVHVASLQTDGPGVLAIGAAQNLHERRFAGAVLAEEHVDFASVERQVDPIERHDARKRLADAAHLENRRGAVHGSGNSTGGPPGATTFRPSQRRREPPGWYSSSSVKTVLMRVRRTGADGSGGNPSRGGRSNACARIARTCSQRMDTGSGMAARKHPLRTMRYSGNPRSDGTH